MPHPYSEEDINIVFEAIMLLNDPIGIIISRENQKRNENPLEIREYEIEAVWFNLIFSLVIINMNIINF